MTQTLVFGGGAMGVIEYFLTRRSCQIATATWSCLRLDQVHKNDFWDIRTEFCVFVQASILPA